MLAVNRLYQVQQGRISLGFQWVAKVSISDAVLRPYLEGVDYVYNPLNGLLAWVENSRFSLPSGWLEVKTSTDTRLITFPSNGRLTLTDKPSTIELYPIEAIQYQPGHDYTVNHDTGIVVLSATTRIKHGALIRAEFVAGGKTVELTNTFGIESPFLLEAPVLTANLTVIEGLYVEGLDYQSEGEAGLIRIPTTSRLIGVDAVIMYQLLSGEFVTVTRFVDSSLIDLNISPVAIVNVAAINLPLKEDIGEQIGDYKINYQTGLITFLGRTPRIGLVDVVWQKIIPNTYATPGDFSNIFEAKETLQITNLGNPEATYPNYEKLWEGLEYASSEIDFRINNFRRVPLSIVPPGIEWKTVVLARAFCDTARVREGVQRDLDIVMKQLKELADGSLSIPDLEVPTSVSAGGAYMPGIKKFTFPRLRGW